MQYAALLPQFGPPARGADVAERVARVAQAADRLGYDVLWTAEHLIFPREIRTPYPYGGRFPYSVDEPILDVVTTLSYVAALTKRVRLGSAVMVLPYHQPVPLAKALATLDVLSGGRLLVGFASGWLVEEFELLGVPFRERGARTDEYLRALRALWTEDVVDFSGRFVRLEGAAFFPKPLQKPHPPIWLGGTSEAALRRVARAGDGWIAAPRTPEALQEEVERLRRFREEAGRDPGALGISSSGGAASVDALLDVVPRLERIGVTMVTVPALFWGKSVEHALELMEEFASRAGLPPVQGVAPVEGVS